MFGYELPQVFLKPIDPHAPRNRKRTGAFEVQLCFHSRKTGQLEKCVRREFHDRQCHRRSPMFAHECCGQGAAVLAAQTRRGLPSHVRTPTLSVFWSLSFSPCDLNF